MLIAKVSQETQLCAALSAATCTLLGNTVAAAENDSGWETDSALLLYVERGRRTEAVEPVIKTSKLLPDGDRIQLKFVVDVITGASPTGAMPSSQPQTFTRPSGVGSYTIDPGKLPVDDTFMDARVAVDAAYEKTINDSLRMIYGGSASYEYDFISLGFNGSFAYDLNQKNTTLSLGLAVEGNRLDPEGGVPVPLATAMIPSGQPQNRQGEVEERSQADLVLGLGQTLGPRTLMQFNLSYSESSGYHTDPFKFISIINAVSGPRFGEPFDNIFENRPDERSRRSLYWKTLHHFKRDAIDIGYRYYSDDWSVRSHTLDLRYSIKPEKNSRRYWQPRIRFYRQQAASFYRTNLLSNEPVPEFVSADYRLSEMDAVTLGIKYVTVRKNDKPFEVRLEYISQDNKPSAGSQLGFLAGRQIVPDTKAVIVQFNYIFW